jgi:hypothetical protein
MCQELAWGIIDELKKRGESTIFHFSTIVGIAHLLQAEVSAALRHLARWMYLRAPLPGERERE